MPMQLSNALPVGPLSHSLPLVLVTLGLGSTSIAQEAIAQEAETSYGEVFDEHWECMRDNYPFFERYGVDWEAEREDHRPRAVAAENGAEFAWEMARLFCAFRDSHLDYLPAVDVIKGWAIPDLRTGWIDQSLHILDWRDSHTPVGPERYRENPHACPEIVSVQGVAIGSAVEILAAGPVGSPLDLRLRWPDGTETDELLTRPEESNLPPPKKHFGERWIVSGRVGSIGYIRVRSFDPKRGTLGPAGKMTPILREHLQRLIDTEGLILDVQGNGGGMVAASDPFLSHFLTTRQSYRWGRSNGRSRVLVPRTPHYAGEVIALVDEYSASGAEWAARILRDADRATVVGGPTRGAEAAVHTFTASDGSMILYSAWPMVEPGVPSFQDCGVELDHALPLTIEAVRTQGYEAARAGVRRARLAKSLELLGAPASDLDELFALAYGEDED